MKSSVCCALGLSLLLMPVMSSAQQPARVVSIGGHVTEIIYALGAQATLVGTDSSSIYPPEAKKLPQVGYLRQVSVEGVASLQPDLIIASHDIGPPAAVEKLKALGVPLVITAQTDTIAKAAERIREVGKALGIAEKAEAWQAQYKLRLRMRVVVLMPCRGRAPKWRCFLGMAMPVRWERGPIPSAMR